MAGTQMSSTMTVSASSSFEQDTRTDCDKTCVLLTFEPHERSVVD